MEARANQTGPEGSVINVVGPLSAPAPGEFPRSRLRTEYTPEAAARREVSKCFGEWLSLVAECGHDGLQISAKEFSGFAKAISFRGHTNGFVPADAGARNEICLIKGHRALYMLPAHRNKHVAVSSAILTA